MPPLDEMVLVVERRLEYLKEGETEINFLRPPMHLLQTATVSLCKYNYSVRPEATHRLLTAAGGSHEAQEALLNTLEQAWVRQF